MQPPSTSSGTTIPEGIAVPDVKDTHEEEDDEEDSEALISALGVSRARDAMFRLHAEMSREPVGEASLHRYSTAAFSAEPWAARYLQALSERGAVDFAGLVYLTRAALSESPTLSQRWAGKFDWVQIDEVQDTHLSEYDVIRHICADAQSLCLVGDLDQTIYGWRKQELIDTGQLPGLNRAEQAELAAANKRIRGNSRLRWRS